MEGARLKTESVLAKASIVLMMIYNIVLLGLSIENGFYILNVIASVSLLVSSVIINYYIDKCYLTNKKHYLRTISLGLVGVYYSNWLISGFIHMEYDVEAIRSLIIIILIFIFSFDLTPKKGKIVAITIASIIIVLHSVGHIWRIVPSIPWFIEQKYYVNIGVSLSWIGLILLVVTILDNVYYQNVKTASTKPDKNTRTVRKNKSPADELVELKDLLEKGLISEDEYSEKRSEIISKL